MKQIKTFTDIQEIASLPLAERNLPPNTFAALQEGASFNPTGTALNFFLQARGSAYQKTESYSFEELLGNVRQAANLFHSLGIGPKDVVSFILPNLPETHWTLWGGEAAGIVNPLNPLLEPEQIAEIMRAAESKVLVALGPFPKTDLWDKVEKIRPLVPSLKTVLRVSLADHLGVPARWLVKLLSGAKPQKISGQKVLDFNQARKKFPTDRFIFERDIQAHDIASYFHTGGTTGTPKLAMHTHANEVFDSWAMMQFLGEDSGKGKNFFCGLPLFHVNAVMVTGLGPWSLGATITLGPPQGYRTPGLIPNFWKIVEHYRLTFFSGVPAVFTKLLDVPIDADVSTLDYAICGAAPMPVEVFKNFEKATGLRILEGYGCTEGTCASSVNPLFGERRIGSIGLPFPYQEMRIARLDNEDQFERWAETEEIGSVLLRGPNVFAGYKDPGINAKAWVDSGDGKGLWFHTGDLGRQDAEGYFWLTGRKKELIIRGGHNIDPKMIEEPMHRHPAVAMAAAVGSPDPEVGEVPALFVQLKPGQQADPQELYEFAKANIPERAAIPKAIHIIDEMPVTNVGKTYKLPLHLGEIERVLRQEVSKLAGVSKANVKARSDKKHGVVVHVSLETRQGADENETKQQAGQLLGRYALAYEWEEGVI